MSFQHHSEETDEPTGNLHKLLRDQAAAAERFQEQLDGRSRLVFSDGRIGPTDDGDLAFAIGSHPDKPLVCIDFGKLVKWVAMPPQQAVELAQSLIKHAKSVAERSQSVKPGNK